MRNLSPLFSSNENGFLGKLNLTKAQKDLIEEAKIKIREHLRSGITRKIKDEQNYDISPRFLSQGSSVYKTRNQPCIKPPQQIDHDLGCYLPLSFIEETGSPAIASDVFFIIVDQLLVELVEQEKWKEVVTNKNTCSRVVVNDEIHIDVPLYSIPDNEYHIIKESAERMNFALDSLNMSALSDIEWEVIKHQVLLAHREDDWIPSDPRKLNDYFKDTFEVKGEQLRRICRYLKAWRDSKWEDGGPSSIYLMVLADSIFQSSIHGRDDKALLGVLKELPQTLEKPVVNPTDETERIRIKDQDLADLILYAKEFASDLEKAINEGIDSGQACNLIRNNLGSRFPYDDTVPFENIRETVKNTPICTEVSDREPENRGRAGWGL